MRRNTMAPMRRTTLGPVTNNIPARPSLSSMRPPKPSRGTNEDDRRFGRRATTTTAVPSATKSDMRRGSSRGSRGSRPSMTYGGSKRRQDPRPLHDRAYMQQCVKDLISYVIEDGYELPISPKILTNPSSRDFQHIFLFLVKKFDPSFEFQKRFEDEVPVVLKALHYPFSISKSALSAVGSPHTWPTLLGVLTWLMGLLKYGNAQMAKNEEVGTMAPHERRQKLFYDNMVNAYAQFLLGVDEYPELDRQLCGEYEDEKRRRVSKISELQEDRNQLEITLNALKTAPSPLELARDHRTSLETNIRKYKVLIPNLVEHAKNVEKNLIEKSKELQREEEKLAGLMEEKALLEDSLKSQKEAGIDSERISADRERLREALRRMTTQKGEVEREQMQVNMGLAEKFGRLEEGLEQYHGLSRRVVKIGESRESREEPSNVDWELVVSRDSSLTEAGDLLNRDVQTEVVPVLKRLKEEVNSMIPRLQEDSLHFEEKRDEAEEELIVLRNDLSMLESRMKTLEEKYQAERTARRDRIEARSKSILEREGQVSKALDERREKLMETEPVLKHLTEELMSEREMLGKMRKSLEEISEKEANLLKRHVDAIKAAWDTVGEHMRTELRM